VIWLPRQRIETHGRDSKHFFCTPDIHDANFVARTKWRSPYERALRDHRSMSRQPWIMRTLRRSASSHGFKQKALSAKESMSARFTKSGFRRLVPPPVIRPNSSNRKRSPTDQVLTFPRLAARKQTSQLPSRTGAIRPILPVRTSLLYERHGKDAISDRPVRIVILMREDEHVLWRYGGRSSEIAGDRGI
jgi:hypothetical protein